MGLNRELIPPTAVGGSFKSFLEESFASQCGKARGQKSRTGVLRGFPQGTDVALTDRKEGR